MRSRTNVFAVVTFAAMLFAGTPFTARATQPSIAELNAKARATGNQLAVAMRVGDSLFSISWPVQVLQVSANGLADHVVVGMVLSGVKFHHSMTRDDFIGEVAELIGRAFANARGAEEVDVWASVPVAVGKGVIVSGDLAMPTTRTVFAVSARRGESTAQLVARMHGSPETFWDEDWSRTAFERGT